MSRRVYVTTAEAIRTLDLDLDVKKTVATQIADSLSNAAEVYDFDADRFLAHALSEVDEKWAYNKVNGGFVPEDEPTEQAEDDFDADAAADAEEADTFAQDDTEATGDDAEQPVTV